MTSEEKKQKLQDLAKKIQRCRQCPLYKTAKQAVPGEGSATAKIMFIGEAPGYYEDQQGRPFVGNAGQLLDKAMRGIGLSRQEVFIANILKHRPPDNRDPQETEIAACRDWLDEQVALIDPKIVVTLGRFSLNKFLPGVTISRVHGQVQTVDGRMVMPMFHPAAALRADAVMRQFLDDFAKLPKFLATADGVEVTVLPPPEQQRLF